MASSICYSFFFVTREKAKAKTRTDSDKRKQHTARRKRQYAQLVFSVFFWVVLSSPKYLSSCCLNLALAAFSRPTCSALNLAFTSFNCQGPTFFGIAKKGGGGGGRHRSNDGRGRQEGKKGRI
jgi:hypothetical protein